MRATPPATSSAGVTLDVADASAAAGQRLRAARRPGHRRQLPADAPVPTAWCAASPAATRVDGLTIRSARRRRAATDRFLLQPVTRAAQRHAPRARRPARHRRRLAARRGAPASPTPAPPRVGALRVVEPGVDPQLTRASPSPRPPAPTPGSCATAQQRARRQRHRHLDGRHADRAERLRAELDGVPPSGDTLHASRTTAAPGRQQRQRAGVRRAARRGAGRRRPRRHHRRLRRLRP